MKVYVDEMVVKKPNLGKPSERHSKSHNDILDKADMKFNPKKCTFRVRTGKFLGYIVFKRGTEGNPRHEST